jgi:hypothetical protein
MGRMGGRGGDIWKSRGGSAVEVSQPADEAAGVRESVEDEKQEIIMMRLLQNNI